MVLTSRPCHICGCIEHQHLFTRRFAKLSNGLLEGYEVVVCSRCGFCYADELPEENQFEAYYETQSKYEVDWRTNSLTEFDTRRFPFAASIIRDWLPDRNARILDVGCAAGGLLAELKRQGYHRLYGVDPSPSCAQTAKYHHNLEVITAPFSRIPQEIGTFDLVIFGAVLEHIYDLGKTVKDVLKLLNPNGAVFVEVPDMTRCSLLKDAPFQEFSVEHINFFSAVSLQNLWWQMGFQTVGIRQTEIDQRPGLTLYEIKAMFRHVGQPRPALSRDDLTTHELERYISRSSTQIDRLRHIIDTLVEKKTPLIAWGVGTLTQGLLATTRLREAKIIAFVDSNPRYVGQQIDGIAILPVTALQDRKEPILISSQQFQQDIVEQIKSVLKLRNKVITLFSP